MVKAKLKCEFMMTESIFTSNLKYFFQVGVFDLDQDDPLMLSNIVGEAVVSCWSMENILQRNNANGKVFEIIFQQLLFANNVKKLKTIFQL